MRREALGPVQRSRPPAPAPSSVSRDWALPLVALHALGDLPSGTHETQIAEHGEMSFAGRASKASKGRMVSGNSTMPRWRVSIRRNAVQNVSASEERAPMENLAPVVDCDNHRDRDNAAVSTELHSRRTIDRPSPSSERGQGPPLLGWLGCLRCVRCLR
jgi:hypothetical protein